MKRQDAWMDGVIKTPPLQHTSSIYNREEGEGKNPIRGKSLPHKREEVERQGSPLPNVECRSVIASPR